MGQNFETISLNWNKGLGLHNLVNHCICYGYCQALKHISNRFYDICYICMNLLINRQAHVFIVNLGSYTDISISIQKKNTSWYLGIYKNTYKSTRKAHLSLWRASHSTEQSVENPFILTQTMVVRIPWWSFCRNKFLLIRPDSIIFVSFSIEVTLADEDAALLTLLLMLKLKLKERCW